MEIKFSESTGKIRPMHAVNNAPLYGARDTYFHYMKEAGIPYARLHDTGGAYGGSIYVDIPNIFRNFDADENDPESYDFAFTDWLLNAIHEQGTEAFYRLGVTIENFNKIKTYHIYPPKDNAKWARICEKIIAHYNEGWANGYHLGIEYWEIWNEPDNFPDIEDNCMWKGTFEEYMELYKVTAPYLKEKFPNIKVGGYASCGFYNLFDGNVSKIAGSSSRTEYFIECFHKFMAFAKENNLPLDFFSWHSYSDVTKNIAYAKYVEENLIKYGFTETESIFNEWNPGIDKRGTLEDSANIAEMMLKLMDTSIDMMMYYDGQIHGRYMGLYNPVTIEPFKAYYTFKAFNCLYKLGTRVAVTDIPDGISCVAAGNESGKAVMLTSKNSGTVNITINGDTDQEFKVLRLNNDLDLEEAGSFTPGNQLEIGEFETVVLIAE